MIQESTNEEPEVGTSPQQEVEEPYGESKIFPPPPYGYDKE